MMQVTEGSKLIDSDSNDASSGSSETSTKYVSLENPCDAPWKGKGLYLDGMRWKILEPLSNIETQETFSPCEGRQVYTCICLDEPWSQIGEAVVKIKFQIYAPAETVDYYRAEVRIWEEEVERYPDCQETLKRYEESCLCLAMCTQPAKFFNQDVHDELRALDHFRDKGCDSAPWLVGFSKAKTKRGVHDRAIVGGYSAFILMTKVPAKPISMNIYRKMTVEERDRVRHAFRRALTSIWECGIYPNDPGMRNVLWDDLTGRCYIVDFEDVNWKDPNTRALQFSEREYCAWGLDEDSVRDWA